MVYEETYKYVSLPTVLPHILPHAFTGGVFECVLPTRIGTMEEHSYLGSHQLKFRVYDRDPANYESAYLDPPSTHLNVGKQLVLHRLHKPVGHIFRQVAADRFTGTRGHKDRLTTRAVNTGTAAMASSNLSSQLARGPVRAFTKARLCNQQNPGHGSALVSDVFDFGRSPLT